MGEHFGPLVAIFGNICKQKVITLLTKFEEDITSVGYGYIGKDGVGGDAMFQTQISHIVIKKMSQDFFEQFCICFNIIFTFNKSLNLVK
jgi:hypothetical protein